MVSNINLSLFIHRIKSITEVDCRPPQSVFNDLIEEIGEFSTAFSVEEGLKEKELDEPAKNEAIDVIISSLALFISLGGTLDELVDVGHKKLDKWELST